MAEQPENGKVVETTTRRRIIPAQTLNAPFEFWEYIEKLKPEDAARHILYVYRDDPAPSMQVGKFVYPWTEIPWDEREEAEAVIAQRWGGRSFRVFVKDRSQRMGVGKIYVNAPPKSLTPAPEPGPQYGSPTVHSIGGGDYGATARVAEAAISTMASQDRTAVDVAVNALRGAADVVTRMSQQPQTQPGPMDDMQRALFAAMIQRLTAPQPDLLESIVKLVPIVQTLLQAFGGTNGAVNPMMQKVLDVALEKVLNPAPSGPATSASAELVRQLPTIASTVAQGIHEWRQGMDAQRDIVMATRPNGGTAQPPLRPPAAAVPAVLPPARTQPNGETPMAPVGLDFVEGKIVEIIRAAATPEEAAETAVDFLDVLGSQYVNELASLGEQGILNLFATRPILRAAIPASPADNSLKEFVRAFLKYASDAPEGDPASTPKPN